MKTLTTGIRPKVRWKDEKDIRWVKIIDILAGSSGDFCKCYTHDTMWCECNFQGKRKTSPWRGRWDEFVADIRDHGLEHPLCWEESGYPNGGSQQMMLSNGHHRLVALIDLGFTEVPVTDSFPESDGRWPR